MATTRSSAPHEERTATEPRENQIEPVILANIREVNDSVRLLRLNAVDPNHTIRFRPGQWIDTFIPTLRQAGGFTITSTPAEARPSSHFPSYIELAVQKSKNPPAQWLWRPQEEILNTQLAVRVGGSFVWPPEGLDTGKIERLALIAGGVGINPLISIFKHLIQLPSQFRPREIHFVYATKASTDLDPQKILFLPRLMDLVAVENDHQNVTLSCYLTGLGEGDQGIIEHGKLPNRTFGRRFKEEDLVQAVDGYREESVFGLQHEREGTVCYVCGPPRMTDEVVEFLKGSEGMDERRVLCEKWW
ncbi:hypothetical protein CKM354_000248500 [Cercospora kikuchii]|uniref:FAD-binding FR-type domain-containing protein n=1 Tax=Cercospora kikuchii TaxID=84275 RepID=A0A9P3C9Z5_9PEZI|nr:uncharacterized protein CKM354_000248500 [Cercospora kikuchii]GIZ39094.1 hypothetical protein CKM354_000248500 [Cercospora kikuchii]